MEGAACAWPFLPAPGEGALGDGVTHFPFLFPFFFFHECIPLTGNKYQDQTLPGKHLQEGALVPAAMGRRECLRWAGMAGEALRHGQVPGTGSPLQEGSCLPEPVVPAAEMPSPGCLSGTVVRQTSRRQFAARLGKSSYVC